MAFDGITVYGVLCELKSRLLEGRIDKISQPAKDEIILSIRKPKDNFKLLLTASPANPRIHITESIKENPKIAPVFCMVLRKHIQGGRVISITQPNFERIIKIEIESTNEIGDLSHKFLIIEIMGKHSNIILTDEADKILDSVKRITHDKSSVREVLPGKIYSLPPSKDKLDPFLLNEEAFAAGIFNNKTLKIMDFIYTNYTGISPGAAAEVALRANIAPETFCSQLSNSDIKKIFLAFSETILNIKSGNFENRIFYDKTGKPLDFSAFETHRFFGFESVKYESISKLLEDYYAQRDADYRFKERTRDIRHIITTNIERCVKKSDMQEKTLKDIENLEAWREKGELITANIYLLKPGMKELTTESFISGKTLKISLDPNLSPSENAQKYFAKYNKAKRTRLALETQKLQNLEELVYLKSVLASLDNSSDLADLAEIKKELRSQGYIKNKKESKEKAQNKKAKITAFLSPDNKEILVGRNNIQNDELTLKTANSSDIWLHMKDAPGPHVIIRTNGKPEEISGDTLLAAAMLALGKDNTAVKTSVDYTLKKFVKKPSGAKPGMVIYDHNKTILVTYDKDFLSKLKKL